MEKFQEVADKWLELQGQVRKECLEYLKRILSENDNIIEWDDADLSCSVTVGYDGGRHPEYASNMWSTVSAVKLNDDGLITLDCEDDSDYEIGNVSTSEIYDMCDFIENILLSEVKE